MNKRIVIIDGHPDEDPARLVHALAAAYEDGARTVGHEVRSIKVCELEFDLLKSAQDWRSSYVPSDIRRAQESIGWASHIVILYPLWLGDMPALLKGFLEQVLRPGFAIDETAGPGLSQLLHGRSARIVVTMGMPAPIYRFYFRARSLKSLEANLLGFVGIRPVAHTILGGIVKNDARCGRWFAEMRKLGSGAD